MADLKSKWDEQTWASFCQRVAQDKARKRHERIKKGIRREPRESLWTLGVAHGLDLLEETPSEAPGVLGLCEEVLDEDFTYADDQDGTKVLAVLERKRAYYEGLQFALKHGKTKARFFAKGSSRNPKQLLVAPQEELHVAV